MNKTLLTICVTALLTTGCAPVLLGGAATAGYLYSQEKGFTVAVEDVRIQTEIKDRLTSVNYKYLTNIDISVVKGEVLLTGVIGSRRESAEVDALVRTIKGVHAVHNELFTDGIYTTKQYSKDSLTAVSIRGRLLSKNDIAYRNMNVTVVNNHAYMIGIARSRTEMTKALHIARTTSGVTSVHNYLHIKGGPSVARQQKEKLTIPEIEEN